LTGANHIASVPADWRSLSLVRALLRATAEAEMEITDEKERRGVADPGYDVMRVGAQGHSTSYLLRLHGRGRISSRRMNSLTNTRTRTKHMRAQPTPDARATAKCRSMTLCLLATIEIGTKRAAGKLLRAKPPKWRTFRVEPRHPIWTRQAERSTAAEIEHGISVGTAT
jgi:hypothetical protein